MFAFLKRRIVIVAIGLVLLALVIWFVGPYVTLGFGEASCAAAAAGGDVALS